MNGLRMHNNEFERRVQQKTEGLKIIPSEGLWDKIEGQLSPEKKRRRVVLWLFFPLLLVVIIAAIWLLGGENDKALQKPIAQTGQQRSASTENLSVSQGNQTSAKENTLSLAPNPTSGQQQNTGAIIGLDSSAKQQPVAKQNIAVQLKTGQTVKVDAPIADNANKRTAVTHTDTDGQTVIAQQQKKGNGSLFASYAEAVRVSITAGQTDTIGLVPSLDADVPMTKLAAPLFATIATKPAMADGLLRPIRSVPINPLTIPSNAASPTGKAKRHWEFGLTFGAGLGNRADNLLSSQKNENGMAALGGGSVTPSSYASGSKPFKPGIVYQIGLYSQKHMGQRWHVQAGLSYSYLSNKQRVGSYVRDTVQRLVAGFTYPGSLNTSANNVIGYSNYYKSGNNTVYTNRIHLLQLPIELQYRLGKQQKWGLQTGVALAYMVQGKMLVYDQANRQYFSNPKAYNRMQLSLQTGAAFYPKPQSSLAIGIRLNYNVNSFVKLWIEEQRILSGLLYCNMPLKKNKR